VEKAAGEIMLQTGNGKGAILDMQQIVSSVSHFAQLTFWPDGECCRATGSGDVEPDVRQAEGWGGADVVGWRELCFVDGHDRSPVAVRLPVRHRVRRRQ